MPLPEKGDPTRPFHVAVHSMRVLGAFLFFIGLVLAALFLVTSGAGPAAGFFVIMAPILIGSVPGFLFLALAEFLARRHQWAIIAAIVVAAIVSLAGLAGTIGMAAAGVSSGSFDLASTVFCLVLAVAPGVLIYNLAHSFTAIRLVITGERGFEPVLPQAAPTNAKSEAR